MPKLINPRALATSNTLTLVITLFANFASATGFLSNATVAAVSHKYDTLFAPAGYAFSIWSLIFLLSVGFVVYQWILLKKGDPNEYVKRSGVWFAVSNVANALWLYSWVNEMIGLSVLLILILLISLSVLLVRLRMELDDEPALTILLVWWPVVIYLGWIIVATIACIASWFVYKGWRPFNLTEEFWTIIMIIVGTLLFLYLLLKRNLREAALVGVWAFVAIAIRQMENNNSIKVAAMVCSAILFIATAIHGYKNRRLSIVAKIKRGEWQ